jgi:hypothetical protein
MWRLGVCPRQRIKCESFFDLASRAVLSICSSALTIALSRMAACAPRHGWPAA